MPRKILNWLKHNLDALCLMLLVSIVYLNISDILIKHHGLPGINKVLVPLLLVLVIFYQLRGNRKSIGLHTTIMVAALYYGFQSGSALHANHIEETRSATEDLFKHLAIAVAVSGLLLRVSSLRYLTWALLASAAFVATLSVLSYYSGDTDLAFGGLQRWGVVIDSYGNVMSARIGGQIGDPNFYSQLLLMILPTGLVFAFNKTSRLEKILAGLCSLVIVLAVICTLSRGGWLVLAVLMIIYFVALLLTFGISAKSSQITLLVFALVLAGTALFGSQQVKNRMSDLLQTIETMRVEGVITDGAIAGRVDEMRVAVHAFVKHPFLGLGYNNTKSHYQDYARQNGLMARGSDRSTHSLYLQVLAEGGILGSIIFLGIVYLAIRCALYTSRSLRISGDITASWYIRGFLFGYFAYLGAGFLLHSGFPRYFWLLTGILISTLNLISLQSPRQAKLAT